MSRNLRNRTLARLGLGKLTPAEVLSRFQSPRRLRADARLAGIRCTYKVAEAIMTEAGWTSPEHNQRVRDPALHHSAKRLPHYQSDQLVPLSRYAWARPHARLHHIPSDTQATLDEWGLIDGLSPSDWARKCLAKGPHESYMPHTFWPRVKGHQGP